MALVNVSNVSKQFGAQVVLEEASLQIHAGETIGLIGPNGAGKTTLFRLIARELPPDLGTITFARGTQVSYLRQEHSDLPMPPDSSGESPAAVPHASRPAGMARFNPALPGRRAQPPIDRPCRAGTLDSSGLRPSASEAQGGPGTLETPFQSALSPSTVYDEAAEALAEIHALENRLHVCAEEMAAATDEAAMKQRMAAYERVNAEFIAAGGHSFRTRIHEVLGGLGFSESDRHRSVSTLSGGERCRVAIARMLLEDSSLLLLDEPTNHLDIDAVGFLEKYLAGYAGGALLISHDRYLLDRVCDGIIELEDRRLVRYSGNYSTFAETKAVRELTRQRQFEQDQEFIAKERAYIAKHLAGQRSNQAKGRRTRLERRLGAGEFVTSTAKERASARITLAKSERDEQVVLRCDDLSVAMAGRLLIDKLNLQVFGGDRLGITGPNGTGKTTLLRTLLGEIEPHGGHGPLEAGIAAGHGQPGAVKTGEQGRPQSGIAGGRFEISPKLRIGYHAQARVHLDPQRTVVDEFRAARSEFSEAQARSYAARFLFRGDDVFKPLGVLSGGEQSRVRLATLILSEPDLLVLDEPTNHLDISSREALEEALTEFNGTIIAVSHDRYFLDRVASRMLVVRPSGWRLFTGNYSDYQAELEAEAQTAVKSKAGSGTRKAEPRQEGSGKGKILPGAASPERNVPDTSQYNHLSVDQIEEMVVDREIRLGELQQRFGEPELYKDPEALADLEDQIEALSDELTRLDAAWHERASE